MWPQPAPKAGAEVCFFQPSNSPAPRPSQHNSAGWAGRSLPQHLLRNPPAHPHLAGMPLSHRVGYLPGKARCSAESSADTWYCYGNSHSHRGSRRECFRIMQRAWQQGAGPGDEPGKSVWDFSSLGNLGPTVPALSLAEVASRVRWLQAPTASASPRFVQNKENLLLE